MNSARRNAVRQSDRVPGFGASGLLPGGAMITFLVLLAMWFEHGWIASERWPVRWIDISAPEQRVSAQQIRARLNDHLQLGFFALDLALMVRELESISWIASARLQRVWPDTLKVKVTEHHPVAWWGERHLISDRGAVFAVDQAHVPQDLPVLSGPEEIRAELIRRWREWRGVLRDSGAAIHSIRVSERGSWSVQTATGMELVLGREQPAERMRRLLAVWPRLGIGTLPVERIDMRYSNGLAVSLLNRAAEAGAELAGRRRVDPEVATG